MTIGTSVNSILSDVFYGCSSLASITIPISVTQIGNNAFYNCAILTVAIAMNNPLEIPSPHPVRDIPFYGTIVNTILPPIAPIITTQPSSAIVNPESSATFFVIATGNPTPNYQWFFNTNSIPGATSSSYTTYIAGNYYVVVTNSEGSVTSNTVTLYVNTTITTGTELIDFMNNSFAINGTIMDNIVINQPLINLTSINKNLTSDSQIIITYG